MKATNLLFVLLAGFIAFAFTVENETYTVDKSSSTLQWVGRKVVGEHSGTIAISNGKLLWSKQALKGGSFEVDMRSVANTDLTDADYNKQLVDHLKSDDFFATEKYPKATFVITKVEETAKNQSMVTGDLTIKGVTKEVRFPATVQQEGNRLVARAKILVDRTQYGIKYGSGSFFDNLGDKAIDNEFELNVALVARR